MQRETLLMHRIMTALSERGCIVLRTNAGTYYTKDGVAVKIGFPGLSDLVGITPTGRFFACEVKVPGQKPRENQLAFLEAVNKRGGIGFWTTSETDAIGMLFGN